MMVTYLHSRDNETDHWCFAFIEVRLYEHRSRQCCKRIYDYTRIEVSGFEILTIFIKLTHSVIVEFISYIFHL